jgi:hypothetical protein
MASPEDIVLMKEGDLLARKNSITKDKLLDAMILLKRQQDKSDGKQLLQEFSKLLDSKLDPLICELQTFKEKLKSFETRIVQLETVSGPGNEMSLSNEEQMMKIVDEVHQVSLRKNNLIINGLQESENGSLQERETHDRVELTQLALALGVDDLKVSEVRRLGHSQSKKPRPLKIKCTDYEVKQKLLISGKCLRSHDKFKRTYVNPDMTRMQQSWNQKLRTELKRRRDNGEDVVIRGGTVVLRSTLQTRKNF